MTKKELIDKLNELRSLSAENEVVEFKEAKNSYDFSKLGKYFSALCNEANLKNADCAWLVFGIKAKGHTIVGSKFRRNHADLDNLKGEIAGKTTNRVTFLEIYELQLPDGRAVMFQIRAAPNGITMAEMAKFYHL